MKTGAMSKVSLVFVLLSVIVNVSGVLSKERNYQISEDDLFLHYGVNLKRQAGCMASKGQCVACVNDTMCGDGQCCTKVTVKSKVIAKSKKCPASWKDLTDCDVFHRSPVNNNGRRDSSKRFFDLFELFTTTVPKTTTTSTPQVVCTCIKNKQCCGPPTTGTASTTSTTTVTSSNVTVPATNSTGNGTQGL